MAQILLGLGVKKWRMYYPSALKQFSKTIKSIILNYKTPGLMLRENQLDYKLECLKRKFINFKSQRMRGKLWIYKQKELIEHLEMFDLRAWHAREAAHTVLGLFPKLGMRALLGSEVQSFRLRISCDITYSRRVLCKLLSPSQPCEMLGK